MSDRPTLDETLAASGFKLIESVESTYDTRSFVEPLAPVISPRLIEVDIAQGWPVIIRRRITVRTEDLAQSRHRRCGELCRLAWGLLAGPRQVSAVVLWHLISRPDCDRQAAMLREDRDQYNDDQAGTDPRNGRGNRRMRRHLGG